MLILLVLIFILLNIADIYTTKRVLETGGHEANQFMAKLMFILKGFWWVGKLLLTLITIICVGYLYVADMKTWAMVIMAIADVFYVWVVVHNTKQIRGRDGK